MTDDTMQRYRIEQKLGTGGMGVVYRATDTHLDRAVAVKVLDETLLKDASHAAIVREARAASALNHPHICTVHEVTELDGRPCIVMEHVDGRSLADAIPPEGLPADLAVHYGRQIAEALAHAHDRGVIHRDLKSANVMVTDDGRVKVLDFGLARRLRESQRGVVTEVGPSPGAADDSVGGTLPYMSPDVLAGHPPSAADDLWSLGVLLYEMASGELPFRGATRFQLATAIQRDAPAPIPGRVSPGLRSVILRCLARDGGTRYEHAHEVRAALEAAYADVPAASNRAPSLRLRPAAIAALAIVGVGLALTLAASRQTVSTAAPPASVLAAAPVAVAVLPFANPGHDPDLDYLTDGMAETVISSLARVPGKLKVISLSAVRPYRGQTVDAKTVGQALDVAAVVYGSIVQRDDVVSVVVELVSTKDQSRMWGETYVKGHRDLMAVQQDISTRISTALHLRLSGDEQQALHSQYPADTEALQLYLKGQYHWYRFTPEDYRRSLAYFQQAIQRDGTYALAHAGVARVLSSLTYEGLLPPSTYREVEKAASTALSLDGTLGAAHEALAQFKFAYEWKWTDAEREFQRALELSPRDEAVRAYYGVFLRTQRRWDEAVGVMKQALALNPLSAETTKALGATYFWAGRHDLAIAHYEKALALDPTLPQVHDLLADAYAAKGMYRQALDSRRTYLRLEGALAEAESLGTDGSEAGYHAAMRAMHQRYLEALQRAAPTQYVSPMEFALTYIALGERDRAFSKLEEAFGQRAPWLSSLAADPAFDPLRPDPRFSKLVARVGVPARP